MSKLPRITGSKSIRVIRGRHHIPKGYAECKWQKRKKMVSMSEIEELAERIVREFKPDRIILFGSYADASPTPDSDVDLLVVLPFDGKPFWKSLEILNRINPAFALDLLARRPDETARRYAQGDPLIHEALDHGKVLYERSA